MMRAARKELGLASSETVVIGDTMDTDILGGVQMGYRTILVLSGGTRREDLCNYAFRSLLPPANPEDDTISNLEEWRLRTA
jgi:NagD protein